MYKRTKAILINVSVILLWAKAFLSMTPKEETKKEKIDGFDQLKMHKSYIVKNKPN